MSTLKIIFSCLAFAYATIAFSDTTGETVRVKGRGIGEDKVAALKDAYRDAVETAVGLYVDSEQLVDNDQLVAEKILTHSNAYIEKYEERNLVNKKGLLEIEIVAWVRKRGLTQKIREVMPTMTVNVAKINQNLYAQVFTEDKRDGDAEVLLKDVLDEFDPLAQLMKVSVVNPKPEVSQSKDAEDVKVFSYQLNFEIDQDKYFKAWMPHMDRIFSQISVSPGRAFNFKRLSYLSGVWREKAAWAYATQDRSAYYAYDKMYFMDAYLFGSECLIWGEECDLNKNHVYDAVKSAVKEPSLRDSWFEVNRPIRRWGTVPKMKAKSKLYVALVKSVNRNGCSGILYELSERSASVISKWMQRYSGLSDVRKTWTSGSEMAHKTVFHLSLKDVVGDEVASGDCQAFNHDMSNVGCVCWDEDKYDYNRDKPEATISYVIYITPWVGCFAGECSTWTDVEVAREDIAKIATISIAPEKR